MKTRNKLLKYLDTSWEMLANNEKPPIIDLSEFNMFSFYIQIFTNRNERKAPFIGKYYSSEELEEDIYGNCLYYWIPKDFKEIYCALDKQNFFHKINVLIKQYGNAIVIKHRALCIKTDESINLYSFYKGLCPDKDILSICIPIRIFELGLWEEGSLMYMTNEDYYNLSKEILVKHEAGELTENQIEEIIGSVIIKEWIIDIKPTQ